MNLFKNMHVLLRQLFVTLVLLGVVSADVSDLFGSGANQQYTLEQAIRGTPDSDYPIYSEAPQTSFTCDGKEFGYYVDEEARCQVFRVCAHTDTSGMGFTFLCPNGTLFSQQLMVCDWYYNVKCDGSSQYFDMNRILGKTDGPDSKIMREIKNMMNFPFKNNDRSGNGRATQPNQDPFALPLGGGDRDGFDPNGFPSFTGNGPSTGFVSGVPAGGSLPPSTLGDGPVFVSNLGELSTDPNSSFDRQKSKVIGVSPDSQDPQAAGSNRKGRKKNGNGNGYPQVSVNNNGFPEPSFGDSVNIGGNRNQRPGGPSTGPSQRKPSREGNGSNGNKQPNRQQQPSQDYTGGSKPSGGSRPSSGSRPSGGSGQQRPSSSGNQRPSTSGNQRPSTSGKQRPSSSGNQGFGNQGFGNPSNQGFGTPINHGFGNQQGGNSYPSNNRGSNQNQNPRPNFGNNNGFNDQPSFGNNNFGNNGVGNRPNSNSNHEDFFNIVYSVINDRHGGLGDGNNNNNNNGGSNRRSDNFGQAPQYEIVPSIDLTEQFHQHGGGNGFPRGLPGLDTPSSYYQQSSNSQYRQQQQRPGQRRSGPNVEVVPVPLRHEGTLSGPDGESTNARPYAIPQSVRDIKASNFVLNYNPILSKSTASRDDVLVQITKAQGTYVNDGNGRTRVLNSSSKFSQKPRAITQQEVTGGRPSSYDVPLNSVGPLEQTRSLTGKGESFKGY